VENSKHINYNNNHIAELCSYMS